MSELTQQQEQALICHLRSSWAKALREKRSLFRQDINSLHYWYRFGKSDFIKRETVSCKTFYDSLDLASINELVNTIIENALPKDTAPEIELDFDSEDNGYDGITYCSIKPYAHIFHYRYSFVDAKRCKRIIRTRIQDTVNDAKWKFRHQYQGKDVKRYLAAIEAVECQSHPLKQNNK